MNKIVKTSLILMSFLFVSLVTPSISRATQNTETVNNFHYTTESFTVYGKCQDKIEGSLKDFKGVKLAKWDSKTQILTVTYNPHELNLMSIKKKVAESGHDTDGVRATDEAYKNLTRSCSYKRKKADASTTKKTNER